MSFNFLLTLHIKINFIYVIPFLNFNFRTVCKWQTDIQFINAVRLRPFILSTLSYYYAHDDRFDCIFEFNHKLSLNVFRLSFRQLFEIQLEYLQTNPKVRTSVEVGSKSFIITRFTKKNRTMSFIIS